MKKRIAMFLCALMMVCAPLAMAQEAKITARGMAEIAAQPDMFTIVSNASMMEITLGRAQESVATVIASATGKLLELGIAPEDMVTENFSYYPEYEYSTSESATLVGYRVHHSLRVTCRDVGMLDSVIAVLADSGMTETWNINFDVSNRSELYSRALELAIGAAKTKAETMAAAGGVTITGVESIEEVSYGEALRYADGAGDAVMMKANAGSGIRSGDVNVSASVTVVYDAE